MTNPTDIAYSPTTWHDYPAVDTAVNAARLNNAESGVASATGQANLALRQARATAGLPSYAPTTLTGHFDPITSAYNVQGLMMRTWRRARGAARMQSKIAEIAFPGDSILIGWNGATFNDAQSIPRQTAAALSRLTGLPIVGSGIVPCVAGGSVTVPNSDRWTYTGTLGVGHDIDFGQYFPGVLTMATTSTATYTALDSGTKLQVFYLDSGAGFSVAVAGSTVGTVTTGGTNAVAMASFTGLTITPGTAIKFTPAANYTNLIGLHVVGAGTYGIRVHNLGLGGTTAAYGAASTNWNDISNGYYGFAAARLSMLSLAGITPDLICPSLGNNDIFFGQSVASIVSGLLALRSMFTTYSCLRIQAYTDSTSANVSTYLGAMYTQADSTGAALMDWQQKIGDRATAANNGDLGPDGFHPAFATMTDFGQSLGQLLAA